MFSKQKDTYKELEQPVGKYSKSHKIETSDFLEKNWKGKTLNLAKMNFERSRNTPSHFLYTGMWIGQISIIPGITSMSM